MALAGRLQDVSLSDVLTIIVLTGQQGALRVERGEQVIELQWRGGKLVSAQARPAVRHLAAYFLERGYVDFATLHRALVRQSQTTPRRLIGELLVSDGNLSEGQLQECLRAQTLAIGREALRWESGRFTLLPAGNGAADSVDVTLEELLGSGRREGGDWHSSSPAHRPGRGAALRLWSTDVLVQHGLTQALRGDGVEVTLLGGVLDLDALELEGAGAARCVLLDLDGPLADARLRTEALTSLRRLLRRCPRGAVIGFGRSIPAPFLSLVVESPRVRFVARASESDEAQLPVLEAFLLLLRRAVLTPPESEGTVSR